jgi:hypothetical protein
MNTQYNRNTSYIGGNALEHVPACSGKKPAWPPTWADSATGRAKGDASQAEPTPPPPAMAPPSPPPPPAEKPPANATVPPPTPTAPAPRKAAPQPPAAPDWPADLAAFILQLTPADLPPTPFHLTPWARVLDSARYLVWLKRDVAMGAKSPRARWGALQRDMEILRDIILRSSPKGSSL